MQEIVPNISRPKIFVNRELSWMEFNLRVLSESLNPKIPLMERLKFLSIYFSKAGLACGLGYVAFAAIFAVVIILVLIVLSVSNFGDMASGNRQLKITIPENLNYTDAFNEVFDSYTTNSQLRKVKTTNMGTLFELTYTVALKKDVNEKNFIDALRVKNGNLNIVLGIPETESTNLN